MSGGYADPDDRGNSAEWHTGKPCIEGCGRPAGTAWSPLWCQPCNTARIDRVYRSLSAFRTAGVAENGDPR